MPEKTDDIYDIIVTGAGLHGASIANEAAARGQRVLLIQAGKLGGSASCLPANVLGLTSGNAMRAIPGFVVENRELARLARTARHLIRPVATFFAGAEPSTFWSTQILLTLRRLGIVHNQVENKEDINLINDFPPDALHAATICAYEINHRRVVIGLIQQFCEIGGHAWFNNRVVDAQRNNDDWSLTVEDLPTGTRLSARGRILINCTGCHTKTFLDQVLRVSSRGASSASITGQLFVRYPQQWQGVVALTTTSPWICAQAVDNKHLCLGPVIAEDASATVKSDAIERALALWNQYAKNRLSQSDIVHCRWSPLPMLDDPSITPDARAELSYLDLNNPGGVAPLLNHFGINFIFYRRIACQALDILSPFIAANSAVSQESVLPGANFGNTRLEHVLLSLYERYPFLPEPLLERLLLTYGTNALAILGNARTLEDMGRDFGDGLYPCEVEYLQRYEWAENAEDVVWRRTLLGLQLTPTQINSLDRFMLRPVNTTS